MSLRGSEATEASARSADPHLQIQNLDCHENSYEFSRNDKDASASFQYSNIKWQEFKIADLFEIVDGYYNKKPPKDENGSIPFLGATQYNNGITEFYTKETILNYDKVGDCSAKDMDRRIFKGNCIAITNNGSVGNVYYQQSDFVCSHDITPLYLKNFTLNRFIALFLIPALQRSGESFEYAKKWRPKRMRKSKILLPINSKNKPDFDFMEKFMRELEYKKIYQILSFYQNKNNANRL